MSQVLRYYLDSVDLSAHLHAESICGILGIKFVQFVSKPGFQSLKYWAIFCFLASDHQFSQRTGQTSIMAILSPSQRSSLRLMMEWWFSEIQSSVFLMKTIARISYICVCPDDNVHRVLAEDARNKYTEPYHGDLLRLFEQEFETGITGETLSSPERLTVSRKAAVRSACCQRMGHEAWCGYQSSKGQSPMLPLSKFMAKLSESTSSWRQQVRRACAGTLHRIMELNAPNFVIDWFWLLLDVATDGPIELYTEMSLHPEEILEANLLSVTLEPLPWLVATTHNQDRPYYLWDRREERTIEVDSLDSEIELDYVAVSHTWGRWKIKDSFAALPGVQWHIPRNSLWDRDVSELPYMLRQVPGHQRYHLKDQEISKQAAIFGKATHAVAWMSTMDKYGLEDLCSTVESLVLGCTAYHKRHEVTQASVKRANTANFSLSLHRADGKPDTVRNSIPLVHERDKHEFLTSDDPQKYVDRWFTSLWTLQEACVRPDMWVCDKNWNLLRLGSTSGRCNNEISLDGIFAVLEDSNIQKYLQCATENGIDATGNPNLQAQYDHFNELIRGKSVSYFNDHVDFFSFLRKALADSGIPEGGIATWDIDAFARLFTEAEAASEALKTQGHTLFDIVQQVSGHVHYFYRMMMATGMTRLVELRSPLDIIAIGERRVCKSNRDRAAAIMSAVGAVEWHRDEDAKMQKLVLGQYPPAFIDELRRKAGDAEFFRSRLLNMHVVRLVREAVCYTSADASVIQPIGSMLPFSNASVFELCLAPTGWPLDSLPIEAQPALKEWDLNEDGSVRMPRAAIVASSHMIRPIPDCWINCIQILLDGHEDDFAASDTEHQVDISLDEWLKNQRKRSGTFYLVNISRQRLSPHEKLGWSSCHGVVLRELRSKVLVKIGAYSLRGHEFYTWPPATRRNWTVF
ncbi:hypothetical protein F5X68DRAFT_238651 [Plectosphaerella plurivora]|uniref:Heterokaryon incompatibility domain-containing protein n=1 Tax=Plectosphaerella plurivora TaxID=936078 RepID=A0A9P8VN72_9PEZI|nr:hypothetical protein F5X68DRAFT_238651 [Plectosphaerella plurivora]